ncbi:phosphohydrolase [Cephaloticoccus capnophilus]|uniref:Phosphohydrolase n=1 Tax=Cephaloticoccus capnophilus TaxID=1548208 RepID=A0A139SI44_9BACT|nr:HDIG domain-containing metalloprotein [Cephaloticoccus capnophilus]KXU34191.1 phosphohydrolase [Cephaloticoccus capnophilus]
MSFTNHIKTLLGLRRQRRRAEPAAFMAFLEGSRLVTALIFFTTVAAIVAISSAGLNTAHLPVLQGQVATVRIAAALPFTYESALRTASAQAQVLERVPPVYRLDTAELKKFSTALRELHTHALELDAHSVPLPLPQPEDALDDTDDPSSDERLANHPQTERVEDSELARAFSAFRAAGPYRASFEDFKILLSQVPDPTTRSALIEVGLEILAQIYADGVHDNSLLPGTASGELPLIQVASPGSSSGSESAAVAPRRIQSQEEALSYLRLNLSGEDVPRAAQVALFRLLRHGVSPNLVFDREATAARQRAILANLKPVQIEVSRGETIIEPDTRVSPEQYEMLMAHRQALRASGTGETDERMQLFGRVLLVLAMVLASVFYVRLEDRETFQSNGRLGLLALVVILNIALVRLVFSLAEMDFFAANSDWASTLPYIAPSAFAPLILAILIDAGSAIFMALFISIFTGLIYGNRLDLLVVTFLASTVAIFSCQDLRRRSRVVRAAGFGGLAIALFALLVGFSEQLPAATLLKQFGVGLASGVSTGILVVGLLPIFETLFKRTTNITLLELTDYNHPLLRKMQIEAPGTYHHSLMVAQLSESAATAIGANGLLARVCALYHDIGKTVMPEYFIENQRGGENPHDENNPSLSALIIKSHVKEGVDIARKHHLPRPIIDVIREHHGTSLIRYFYHRECVRAQSNNGHAATANTPTLPGIAPAEVAESTYRYDGPLPRTKESAIISLADGIEAASRSLRQLSPQHINELIDSVITERVETNQLDESSLTFAELSTVKESFSHTMINMLHSRIEYPKPNDGKKG